MIRAVNEQTTPEIDFVCYDADGVEATPATLSYRIDNITSGTEILTDTSITAVSSGTLELTVSDTTLVSQDSDTELFLVTMTATYSGSKQHIETYQYEVRNLRAIT